MAFANPNISDLIATTLEYRSGEIADNVTNSNSILKAISKSKNVTKADGGQYIMEVLSFAQNANATFYSGYDVLPTGAQDVITGARFDYKLAAVPVVVTGQELLLNGGKQQIINLVTARVTTAVNTLKNVVVQGIYSDGTSYGGKGITGLQAAVPLVNTSGVYGGIDRAVSSFWRNQKFKATTDGGAATTSANIQGYMNQLWLKQIRGADQPNLIVMDTIYFSMYQNSLQALQRFSSADTGNLGFPSIKFMSTDVVSDNAATGIPTKTMYMLNTDYLKFRAHPERNFGAVDPEVRSSFNQDAKVQMVGWMGNLTCSGAQFQGVMQE
jgi:hypothetical protein